MSRRILAITGTRAEYGSMRPVFRRIRETPGLELDLLVTAMHLAQQFQDSLAEIESDGFGNLHYLDIGDSAASGHAMALSFSRAVAGMAVLVAELRPDLILLQGDRGEMLAGAIAASHQNVPIVHMSGGDQTGSIDDPIRNAITSFAHIHLTSCAESSARLLARGEAANRVFEVGEPALDVIKELDQVSPEALAQEFRLDLSRPLVLATQHPVTTEVAEAAAQMMETLEALSELGHQTIFTYPNTDAGGREMVRVLESYAGRNFLRIVPHVGSRKYMSLMRIASVMVGNSSSGILEAASFELPVVNIGTRQHGRTRAGNVIDVDYARESIKKAVQFALENELFRSRVAACVNPYGNGEAAKKTVNILRRLRLIPTLLAKWLPADQPFVE